MEPSKFLLIVTSFLLITGISNANKVTFEVSKKHLDISKIDTLDIDFFLISPAKTTIKYVNIYGGEEIIIEKDNLRSSGEQKITIYSDSLKIINRNISSGVYYLLVEGNYVNGDQISFNSFKEPWGQLLDINDVSLDQQAGLISYSTPSTCFTKLRIGFDNGPVLRTLINLSPESKGNKTISWDGYDQTGLVSINLNLNPKAKVIAFDIPKTSFYLENANNPIDFQSEAIYPENWSKYALNPYAKTSWKDNIDVPLKFSVEAEEDNNIAFDFEVQNQSFNNVFSSLNEIYISIDNEYIVENPNVMVPGQYTVAFPELENGTHTVLVNFILPNNVVATGTYELNINN